MMLIRSFTTAVTCLSFTTLPILAAPAQAQLGEAASGILGNVLPDIGSVGLGNATGLLGYCVKNKLLGSVSGVAGLGGLTGQQESTAGNVADNPASILGVLTKKQGVTRDKGYLAGQKGIIQTGSSALPLGGLGAQLKAKACDLVLGRAKSFL